MTIAALVPTAAFVTVVLLALKLTGITEAVRRERENPSDLDEFVDDPYAW